MAETLSSVQLISTSGLTVGSTNLATFSAPVPSGNRTYTVADPGSSANFVMNTGGALTVSGTPSIGQALTATGTNTASWQTQGGSSSEVLTLSASSGTQVALTLTHQYSEVVVNSGVTPLGYAYWAAQLTSSSGFNNAYCCAVDPTTNYTYVGGYITGSTATIVNSDATTSGTIAVTGTFTAYLVKYDPRGFAQWSTSFTTASGHSYVTGICVSGKTSNVYISGSFDTGTMTLNNSDGTAFTTLALTGSSTAYVACYNSAGFGVWATRITGSTSSSFGATSISVNSLVSGDQIYASFVYSGTGTIYSAGAVSFATLTNAGTTNTGIVSFNNTGIGIWSAYLSTTGTSYCTATCVDANTGNMYVCGYYGSTLTAHSSSGAAFGTTLSVTGTDPAFLVKYNSAGIVQWVIRVDASSVNFNQISSGFGTCCTVNSTTGDIYFIGAYNYVATLNIYNAAGSVSTTLTGVGSGIQTAIVGYSTAGTPLWATQIANTSSSNVYGCSISVNTMTNNVYCSGWYTGAATVYNSSGSGGGSLTTLAITGGADGFVASYNGSTGAGNWATRLINCPSISAITFNPNTNNVYVVGQYASSSTLTVYNSDTTTFGTTLTGGTVYFVMFDDLVTNYSLSSPSVDPTNKTLLFQNNATVPGSVFVVPAGTMVSANGKTVYRAYFTTTGQILNLTWTNSQWSIDDLTVSLITSD